MKHEYRVNKAEAYSSISDHLVSLFLSRIIDLPDGITKYEKEIRRHKTPIRPDRQEVRSQLTSSRRLHYHLYRKRRR